MMRVVLSMVLALFLGASVSWAQDAPKKEGDKKPAAERERKPMTDAERKERITEMFKKRDANGDGKLTLEELKGKTEASAARAERVIKARDKDGDGAVTLEEMLAKPERKERPKKDGPKKEKKDGPKKGEKKEEKKEA